MNPALVYLLAMVVLSLVGAIVAVACLDRITKDKE